MKLHIPVLSLFIFMSAGMAAAAPDGVKRTGDPRWVSFCDSQADGWYATDDAVEVAENVLLYQKVSGGWPKNVPMHKYMTPEEKARVASEKDSNEASKKGCMDNDATTSEIRFLARMYRNHHDKRYLDAFLNGIRFILGSQYAGEAVHCGGWPQYYPLRGGYSDYFTFNDNLHINNMLLLSDLLDSTTEVGSLLPDDMREDVGTAYEAGLRCMLDCQVTEDGVKTLWCAQHDPVSLLPAEGRPHELPSYSADEGTMILWFLMTRVEPTPEIVDAVESAVAFLNKTAIEGKKPVFVTGDRGKRIDEIVVDDPDARMWGRFIQLGGDVADKVYPAFFERLKERKPRRLIAGSDTLTYEMWRNAADSYNPAMAHKPIFSIYDDDRPHHLFRFLYSFSDLVPEADSQCGYMFAQSLNAERRIRYRYLGTWPEWLLTTVYPQWRNKVDRKFGKKAVKN